MATKAAKSITINATKYELANALDYQGGKVQLKAKDVVLDEVEVGDSDFVITLAENQNFASNGSKTLAESFDADDLVDAIEAGKRVKVLVPKFENGNEAGYTDYAVITPDVYYDFSAAQIVLVFDHYDNYHQATAVKQLLCGSSGTVSSLNLYNVEEHTGLIFNLTCAYDDGDNYPSTSVSDYTLNSVQYEDGMTFSGTYAELMSMVKSGKYDVKAVVTLSGYNAKYVYPLTMASDRSASYEYAFTSTYAYATDIRMDLIKIYGWSSTLAVDTVLRKTV